MRIVAKSIEMIAHFTNETIKPLKFKLEIEYECYKVIRIDKIIKTQLEKTAGNRMYIFTCSSVIDGMEKLYEIKYDIGNCKWILFKF